MSCHGCCSILPIYKPSTHSVKESPLISAKSPWPSARAFPLYFALELPPLGQDAGQDNACAFAGHLLTVRMRLDPAGDGSPLCFALIRKKRRRRRF